MNKAPSSPVLRSLDALLEGRTGSWFINIVVIPALVLVALVLPPLALPQRLFSAGYTGVSATAGGGVANMDGTEFSIPAGATKNGVSIKLGTMSRDAFLNSSLAQSLPAVLDVKSPLYQPSIQGQVPSLAILSISIPEESDPLATLDVYGHVGKKWVKLPFQIYLDSQRIETYLSGAIPDGVVVAQTQTQTPVVSADLGSQTALPAASKDLLAEVNPLGLTIADSGGIAGNVSTVAEASASSPYQVLPSIGNVIGDQLRTDLTDDMITNPDTRQQHIQALVDLAVEKLYPGLTIDYQGITPDNKGDFTIFVRDLAQALHAKDKILAVTLAMPVAKAADTWDTGAFDWAAIGQYADIVKVPLPTSRDAYSGSSPLVESYLSWAVGRVDRYKIELAVSACGRDEFGKTFAPINFSTALKLMGPLTTVDKIEPGGKVTFDLPKLRESGLKYDAATGLYSFGYKDDKGQAHTVWLESADSLSKRINLAMTFNVRGIALRDVAADGMDARGWDALKQYRQTQSPSYKSTLAIVWRVNGQVAGKAPLTDPKFVWTAPSETGDQKVEAAFSFDDGKSTAGSTGATTVQVMNVAPPPKSSVAPPAAAAGPKPTTAPKPPAVAAGPSTTGTYGFSYGAQLNWTNSDPGNEMSTLKGMGFNWAKIQVRWCDVSGSPTQADLSQIGRLLDIANANGIKVLLSVVCAPKWSRADGGAGGSGPPDNMQQAADFMGGMSSYFCSNPAFGAIEVWNEHNLLTEWHGKQISAAMYMDMLKRSYQSIKGACGRVVVVSGAPTPTGVNSAEAIDDVAFLQQMYANGLAQYSDAIGAHPSGFCNAPDAVEGTANPCGGQYNNHRSFFIRRTLEEYRKVMVANGDGKKQIWPTEFGWGVAPNPKPGYEYEKAISEDVQAQWLVRAYQMMKGMGYVGVSILWNLDFTDMNNETGAFHVVGRPAQSALAGMAK